MLRTNDGRNVLAPLLTSGKLQKLFEGRAIINSVDDFITKLDDETIFKTIFSLK